NEVRAFLGLGSNLGDRLSNLRRAVELLAATDGIRVVRTSSVYETDPVGPPQPDYLNAVAEVRTTLPPLELLSVALEVEHDLHRGADQAWGPRPVDVAVLPYGDEHIDDPGLAVPHPRMRERAFVMVPLRELEPTAAPGAIEGEDGVRPFGPPIATGTADD